MNLLIANGTGFPGAGIYHEGYRAHEEEIRNAQFLFSISFLRALRALRGANSCHFWRN
jgi:hypothetical protein